MTSTPAGRRVGEAVVFESLGGETMNVFRAVWPARGDVSSAGGHPYRSSSAAHAVVVVARCLFEWNEGSAEYVEYLDRLVRLRRALGPEHCPRVIHVYAVAGMSVSCIEEDVGDVSFRSLMNRLREPLPLGVTLHLARAFVSAWHALEVLGLARDAFVDDSGIRLGWDGRVRLLACPAVRPPKESDPTIVLRTPKGLHWFPPEVLRGTPGPKSAMFGVGMMLFEALAGQHPFRSGSDLDVLAKLMDEELPDVRTVVPHVPPPIAALVQRCAAKRAEDRFASWADLHLTLENASRAAEPPDRAAEELRHLLERAFPAELAHARERELEAPRLATLTDAYERTETRTAPMKSRPRLRVVPPNELEPRVEVHGGDERPMIRVSPTLLVDLRPVSCEEYARYLVATNRRAVAPPPELAALPVTGITLDDAQSYAEWANKRIPDGDEWEIAVRTAGEALLDVGLVWELTSGERAGDGWLVRGGPWRDDIGERGHAQNLSHSDAAPDVGFRCVADD